MQVIPVVDIRGGAAVAAVRGDRARYLPIETPLAPSTADPVAVALGLSTLFPFSTLYIADLDGIEGRGADLATQARLMQAWPGAELWIDDGIVEARAVPPPSWGRLGGGDPQPPQSSATHVLGSESLASLDAYARARQQAGPAAPLSLDFRGDRFIGPEGLLEDAALWPERVIVMTLARVGSGEGPDLTRLGSIVARAGVRKVYAAGGVRNAEDLHALRDVGAAGALIATALHSGAITAADIERCAAGDA